MKAHCKRLGFFGPLVIGISGLFSLSAEAGLFNVPHFVEPGNYAIGVEPELYLTSGAGAGANLKYTHGLGDLTNAQAVIGTGSGPRKFRFGGSLTFDVFPDVDRQPGIGLNVGSMYVRTRDHGQLEMIVTPYLHKAITTKEGATTVDPFVGVPFGWAFYDGKYDSVSSINFGGIFGASEKFKYVMEISVAINHRESTISGGLVYSP